MEWIRAPRFAEPVRVDGVPRPTIVELVPGHGAALVVVHDETGTVSDWRGLVGRLPDGQPVLGLEVTDAATFAAIEPRGLLDRVAAAYVATLVDAGHARVSIVGAGTGAVLAAEVARQLGEVGVLVERSGRGGHACCRRRRHRRRDARRLRPPTRCSRMRAT